MTYLPSNYPRLSLHLTDRAHTPFISSPLSQQPRREHHSQNTCNTSTASRQSQLQALHTLTTTALTAHDAASRLGLGLPVRIMVEHGPAGPVALTSYIRARRKEPESQPTTGFYLAQPPQDPTPKSSLHSLLVQGHQTRPDATESESAREQHPSYEHTHHLSHKNGMPVATQQPSSDAVLVTNSFSSSPVTTVAQPPSLPFKQSITLPNEDPDDLAFYEPQKPLLLALVVAPAPEDLPEARRAAARLERMGRELQEALALEEFESLAAPGPPGTEVGGDSAPATVGHASVDNTTDEEDGVDEPHADDFSDDAAYDDGDDDDEY